MKGQARQLTLYKTPRNASDIPTIKLFKIVLQGGGTRKGSGACRCDTGYAGEFCENCKVGYYNNTPNQDSWECAKCDKACKAHCREGGPKGCEVCADGYQYSIELGCIGNCFIDLYTQI